MGQIERPKVKDYDDAMKVYDEFLDSATGRYVNMEMTRKIIKTERMLKVAVQNCSADIESINELHQNILAKIEDFKKNKARLDRGDDDFMIEEFEETNVDTPVADGYWAIQCKKPTCQHFSCDHKQTINNSNNLKQASVIDHLDKCKQPNCGHHWKDHEVRKFTRSTELKMVKKKALDIFKQLAG